MAEWLRRLTRNQFPSGSAGSNPADCEELFPFPHLWHSNCDKPLFIFHNCSIQALALTFIKHLTFKPAHTLWTITVCLSWSIVGSVVECSPATRAARVRFPDDAIFFSHLPPKLQIIAALPFPLWKNRPTAHEKSTFIAFSNGFSSQVMIVIWAVSLQLHIGLFYLWGVLQIKSNLKNFL